MRTTALLVVVVAVMSAMAYGDITVLDDATVTIVEASEPLPTVLGFSDVDKSHDGAGGWSQNWWDDVDDNGAHDTGEAFADSAQAGWGNPKSAGDNSCWLASACNMLEQLGKIPDADALYADYALNGVPSPSGVLTWDEGGLQEYAVQHWMNQHPAAAADMTMNVHWRNAVWTYSDGMFTWDWVSQQTSPRAGVDNYLLTGWEVGIGMWPLFSDGVTEWHEGGHALTMQQIHAGMTFDCTDSDRDADWVAAGDLNTYNDALRGPGQAPDGTWLWGWYNDFYDGNIGVYPVGDVGYVCAIIPEPATVVLLILGSAAVWRKRK